ncbi:Ankyrin repeat domain-containing protein EMB506, chloroplastic [Linum perenne]
MASLARFQSFWVIWVAAVSFTISISAQGEHRGSSSNLLLGQVNLGSWRSGISEAATAQAPGPSPYTTLVLAADRTNRPDILNGFKHYRGGWDITNRHYWASVGFTGASGFVLAVLWFFSFALAVAVHHCCGWKVKFEDKELRAQRICFILLIVFTCAAAIGCVLLSVGQGKFNGEAKDTLKYVVNQSDYTVQTLRNVTEYLSLAKTIKVAQVFLPSNVMDNIDKLNVDLNSAANTLEQKTSENSEKIATVFTAVRSALIAVAAVMLVLAVVGFVLSVLGHQHAIYIFVLSGWLLVAITFILCGLFIIFHNAITDTCTSMNEWVQNPQAASALSNILPCVDQSTTNKTLFQSKEVVNDIVNVVNTYIYTFANSNPSKSEFNYYNQSGPLMPPMCYPFDSQLHDRQCTSQEVSFQNASTVWESYVCQVSSSGYCTTVGRVTPDVYGQLIAAVNETYALEYYTPLLLSLQDCKFVRDTFEEITSKYCPPLEHYLQLINAGLGLISVGVLLCLVLWILYANRPQREEAFGKLCSPMKGSGVRDTIGPRPTRNNSEGSVQSSLGALARLKVGIPPIHLARERFVLGFLQVGLMNSPSRGNFQVLGHTRVLKGNMVLSGVQTASSSRPLLLSLSHRISVHKFSRNGRFAFRLEQKCPAMLRTTSTSVVDSNIETRYGVWEDPRDDDDDDDEDEENEQVDSDDESDSRGRSDALITNTTTSSDNYDQDLVKEVEQLFTPEERAIFEQNETPNLGKISTGKWQPLQTLALSGQIRHMDRLVQGGLDIDGVDKDGRTALHTAVIGKKDAVISHLLRKGSSPHIRDKDGATPLHYAAQAGALQTVKLLIKYKVDVNVTDEEGWTPLHIAVQSRNRDIAKVLLVNGADETRRNKVLFVQEQIVVDECWVAKLSPVLIFFQNGTTALDIALRYGRDFKSYDLAKLLKAQKEVKLLAFVDPRPTAMDA